MSSDWTALEYERQRRRFIESRLLHRNIYLHSGLIFGGTLLAGWAISWALRIEGIDNFPLRYAIGFVGSYAVFIVLVRVWADYMRQERGGDGLDFGDGVEAMDFGVSDVEGCFIVLACWLVGLLLAGVFAWMGGMPLLLEVAFEVVFAGVVVRRARRTIIVGDWLGALLRRTWLHASVTGFLLVCIAGYVQHKVPQAHTLREALQILLV